LTLDTSRIVAL